jgi:hypothetical protein
MPARLAPLAREALRRNATNAERRAGAPAERGRALSLSPPGRARRLHRRLRLVRRKACHRPPDCDPGMAPRTRPMGSSPARLARAAALAAQGFALLRFANDEAFHNLEDVLETVRLKLIELKAAHRGFHGLSLARSPSCPCPARGLRLRPSGANRAGMARPPILSFPHHRASGRTPVSRRAMGGRDASDAVRALHRPTDVNLVALWERDRWGVAPCRSD